MSPSLSVLVARNAVADDMVDRDAAAPRVAAIAERRRHCRRLRSSSCGRCHPAPASIRRERRAAASASRISAARRPARCMPSNASGPCSLMLPLLGFDAIVGGDGDILGHRRLNRHSRAAGGRRASSRSADADDRRTIWTAALVVIGDEILSGRTQDKNIAQVATVAERPGDPAGRSPRRPRRSWPDRRGGERASRRARLSVHDGRHRPDPRRHHRRRDRRGLRRAGGRPSRSAARSWKTITATARAG